VNPFESDLLELLEMAETPLYSAYRWLEKDLSAELSMVEFLRLVDRLIERDMVRLWHVDWETHAGSRVPAVPPDLVERYAAHPDLDEHWDPLGYSLAIGPSADGRQPPEWELDVDFVARSFVMTAVPDTVSEALAQVSRLYATVAFVEMRRDVVGSRLRIEGVLADKGTGGDGDTGPGSAHFS
jgi:hypothetical protein